LRKVSTSSPVESSFWLSTCTEECSEALVPAAR
jgi:hypothetical protein